MIARNACSRSRYSEDGAVMVLFAVCVMTICAFAALAIDGGLAHNEHRTAQNVADVAAMSAAWADCTGGAPVAAALGSAARNGYNNDGVTNTVAVTSLPDGTFDVVIRSEIEAEFARTINVETLNVTGHAVAACQPGGPGALPFGALPGGFGGGLQAPNPCGTNSGNCGRLFVTRLDGTIDTGPITIANIAYGSDRSLEPSWTPSDSRVECNTTTEVVCSIVETNTGVAAAHLGEGFMLRLSDTAGASQTFSYGGTLLNGDTLTQVLGGTPTLLRNHGKPVEWIDGLHGDYNDLTLDLSNHYWYDQPISKCDSPRWATTPIVSSDLDFDPTPGVWTPGVGYPGWPSGSKSMKVLGHYIVYVDDPNDPADFQGSGNLKKATAKIMWLGPTALSSCPGLEAAAEGSALSTVFLVE